MDQKILEGCFEIIREENRKLSNINLAENRNFVEIMKIGGIISSINENHSRNGEINLKNKVKTLVVENTKHFKEETPMKIEEKALLIETDIHDKEEVSLKIEENTIEQKEKIKHYEESLDHNNLSNNLFIKNEMAKKVQIIYQEYETIKRDLRSLISSSSIKDAVEKGDENLNISIIKILNVRREFTKKKLLTEIENFEKITLHIDKL